MRFKYISIALLGAALSVNAQSYHDGDISWPASTEFASNVKKWKAEGEISGDDNFFISRVRPRLRFRNQATQVNPDLREGVSDKRLCAWLPINIIDRDGKRNALPTGEFDSECFTMWSYVDHWGNWSAPLGAIPGNFTDAAHKNGVSVSSVASIPFGTIGSEWSKALNAIAELDPNDAAEMLVYYGADGIGYNSEFSGYSSTKLAALRKLHQGLTARINELYGRVTPGYAQAENLWYDGTSTDGEILFDYGLGNHNIENWGAKGEERTSLFFNYNWNREELLQRTVDNAASLAGGRSPLFLYCGVNMQGGEPRTTKPTWSVMKDYPVSIGLWGAHSENMFWQMRTDNGQAPETRQQTYQSRIEQWFSGGKHNPAVLPEITTATRCNTDDDTFHGMATFMSARSALSWDLSSAPFISCFNVGNGRFFNWGGVRANDNEWYNIGIQDYMPTWRWWISDRLLGRTPAEGSETIKPAFTWDDAWLGGSCLRIKGNAAGSVVLHLFKTDFVLSGVETLTLRYKSAAEPQGVALIGSLAGKENDIAIRLPLTIDDPVDANGWRTATLSLADVAKDSRLAMLALEFTDSKDLDLKLGEVSLRRGNVAAPKAPEVTRVEVLRNTYSGIDAKIIFNVPNDKPVGEVCYNDDVNVSMFKIYSQEEGCDPSLRGATTSWAAMSYATPFSGDDSGCGKIRFGVSAVGYDFDTETPIAWSDWMDSGERIYSDDIAADKSTITPDEPFTLRAIDKKREFEWKIMWPGSKVRVLASSDGYCNEWQCSGISRIGSYDLQLSKPDGSDPIIYRGYIAVTDPERGRVPEIESLTANGEEGSITLLTDKDVKLEYTGRQADGKRSRGLAIDENSFGIRLGEVLESNSQSFSVAGWMKVDKYPGAVNWIDVARRDGLWPRNNWGWLWTSLNPDGSIQNYDQDYSLLDKGATTRCLRYVFGESGEPIFNKGQWNHFAMVFDRNDKQTRTLLYINGKLIDSLWGYFYSTDYHQSERTQATGETLDYAPAYKSLNLNNYLIIGGTRRPGRGHGGMGFTGVLDDIEVWNRAMTEEEVAASYSGNDPENLPDGLAAFFDFESPAGADNMIAAKGNHPEAKGGYFQLKAASGAEGQSSYEFLPPTFTSGTPFIPGRDYKISTVAEWKVPGAKMTMSEGNDVEGKAIVSFPVAGDYTASLTLRNDLGSDSRDYSCIVIGDTSGADTIDNIEERAILSIDGRSAVLTVASDGDYAIRLFDTSGRIVKMYESRLAVGDNLLVTLPSAGIYLLDVVRDGKNHTTYKLICR